MVEQENAQGFGGSQKAEIQNTESLSPSTKGRYRLFALKANPQLLAEVLENEGRHILELSGFLSSKRIKDLAIPGGSGFIARVYRYYPGGIKALRSKLEEDSTRHHWQASVSTEGLPQDKRGRILWSELAKDQAKLVTVLKSEVLGCITSSGVDIASKRSLEQQSRYNLSNVIQRFYPGGWNQFKKDTKIQSTQKPAGFWTSERIRQEALQFYQATGNLSGVSLVNNHRADLSVAIARRYPGGMKQLKTDIGIAVARKPSNYWTPETIEKEAREFYAQHGHFSKRSFEQQGRGDLAAQIKLKYPGQMTGLKRKLGLDIPVNIKRSGYWTPEVIKKEAEEYTQTYGELTQKSLQAHGRYDLAKAITKKYPGGFATLKEQLGLTQAKQVNSGISSEEADEELRRLMEE